MKIDFPHGEILLSPNQPLRLRRARNVLVCCTGGTIWITLESEASDIFLTSGQDWRIQNNGLCLIESLGNGSITLENSRSTPKRQGLVAGKISRTNPAALAPDWSA